MQLEVSHTDITIIQRSLEHTLSELGKPEYTARHGKEATDRTITLAQDLYKRVITYEENA